MAAQPRNETQAVSLLQHPPKLVPIPGLYHASSLETPPTLPSLEASHSHPTHYRWSEFSLSTTQSSANERLTYHAPHPCYHQSPLHSGRIPDLLFEHVHSQFASTEPQHDSHRSYETYLSAVSTHKPSAIMPPQACTEAALRESIHDSLQYQDFRLFPCHSSVPSSRICPSSDPPRAPHIPRLPTPVIGCPQSDSAELFMGHDRPKYEWSDKAYGSNEEEDRVLYLPPVQNGMFPEM